VRIDVYFSIPEAEGKVPSTAAALVVDVIRATSTMVEALANGARAIYPVLSTEDAMRLANSMGRENTLICGERKGLPIEGFDLGNSPREFTRERVGDKQLVMTTTNGTRAFLAAQEASPVVAASFLNLTSAARAVAEADHVVVICAGKQDQFSGDDSLCGGHLVKALTRERPRDHVLNDAAMAALALARVDEPSAALFRTFAAGRALLDINLSDDLPVVAQVDRHDLVPVMVDRVIRVQA